MSVGAGAPSGLTADRGSTKGSFQTGFNVRFLTLVQRFTLLPVRQIRTRGSLEPPLPTRPKPQEYRFAFRDFCHNSLSCFTYVSDLDDCEERVQTMKSTM